MAAIFIPQPDGSFLPTDHARSAWGDALVHGGPPAGLLARAIEREFLEPGWHLARLTVDLFRPVPLQRLFVELSSVRRGRRIHAVSASLVADGLEITRASAVILRESPEPYGVPPLAEPAEQLPPPPQPTDPTSPLAAGTSFVGFHTTVEAHWTRGSIDSRDGRRAAWMRVPLPLVEGEPTSPLSHVAALSDFGNALGGVNLSGGVGMINVDITLYLHRVPRGEWVHLATTARPEPGGHGIVETVVSDTDGPAGRIVQATLANPR